MNRRPFVTGLGAVLAAPLCAEAQQKKVPLLGYLGYGTPGSDPAGIAGLREGLRELGFVDLSEMESVAPAVGLQLISRKVKHSVDIDPAFDACCCGRIRS